MKNPYATRRKKPPNPYKNTKSIQFSRVTLKGIRKKSSNSRWYLTNKKSRRCNYSVNFNGPVDDDDDELILIRPIVHSKRVSWGVDQTIVYEPPQEYNPWDDIHRMDSLVKILNPRKF